MKRVFILSRRFLFHQGIETLLRQEPGLDIIGIDEGSSNVAESIHQQNPDVVIVNLDDPVSELFPAVLSILKNRRGKRIIGLSMCDNRICVYRGEEKEVRDLSDLMEAIMD